MCKSQKECRKSNKGANSQKEVKVLYENSGETEYHGSNLLE